MKSFVQQVAKNPKFYMLLSYALNFMSGLSSFNKNILSTMSSRTSGVEKKESIGLNLED